MAAKAMQEEVVTKAKLIPISDLKLGKARIKLVGTSPLITHNFSKRAIDGMLAQQMGSASKKKSAKDPKQDFMDSLYPMHGTTVVIKEEGDETIAYGDFGFPAVAFKAALAEAAVDLGIYKTQIQRALRIGTTLNFGELIKIDGPPPVMRRDMCRVGPQKVADIRFRAEFREWSVTLDVQWAEDVMTLDNVLNLFRRAGFSVGVGEWRMKCPKGIGAGFGSFDIDTNVQVRG